MLWFTKKYQKLIFIQNKSRINSFKHLKLLKIGTKVTESKVEYLNLLSTDTTNIEIMADFVTDLIIGPIKIALIIILLIINGSYLMFSGLIFFVLVIPVQFCLSQLFGLTKQVFLKQSEL
jgi:hypothetical protein